MFDFGIIDLGPEYWNGDRHVYLRVPPWRGAYLCTVFWHADGTIGYATVNYVDGRVERASTSKD